MEQPIFIFATGWRTGSTLVQRVISTHRDILIWGENHGLIPMLQDARRTVEGLQEYGSRHLENYRKQGGRAWMAVMNPPVRDFDEGLRRLLETYYRDPARELGKSRWGFKEVRHTLNVAEFLYKLYPAAKVLLLLRHPADCLASARGTHVPPLKKGILAEVGGPRGFLEIWTGIASSFVSPGALPHLTLHYEELVEDPAGMVSRIADFLDVSAKEFDLGVFVTRRRGWLGLPPRLTREDRFSLRADWLWEVAGKHGYHPKP